MYVSNLTSPVVGIDPSLGCVRDERGQRLSCGYIPRDWESQPAGSIECCEPLPDHLYIPRSQWREMIERRERGGRTIKSLSLAAGIKTVSQNGTYHCHAFGSCRAGEILEAIQGNTHIPRSPTAVACIAVNFRNKGGNTFDNLPVMAERGMPTASAWPLNRIDRRYDTPEVWETGKDCRLTKHYELPMNNFEAAASVNLGLGLPVIIGVPWGRGAHMVVIVDIKALPGGKFGAEIWNSHGMNYGEQGFAVLPEKSATAFDQAAPYATVS